MKYATMHTEAHDNGFLHLNSQNFHSSPRRSCYSTFHKTMLPMPLRLLLTSHAQAHHLASSTLSLSQRTILTYYVLKISKSESI